VFYVGTEVRKDPETIKEVLLGLDAKKWRLVILSEYKSLFKQKT
jgi:hypothetical protein